MAQTNPPQGDRSGDDYTRGPNPNPGGDIDPGDIVPPYDDRNTGRNERSQGPERMLSGEEAPEDTVQPESSAPYSGEAEMPPEGVGESVSQRGEDARDKEGQEAGRQDEGTQGETERSVGSSDERDTTGI